MLDEVSKVKISKDVKLTELIKRADQLKTYRFNIVNRMNN